MTDYTDQINRDLALFKRLVEERSKNPLTPEEARKELQEVGILDENGEFTAPYQTLGRWVKENSPKK